MSAPCPICHLSLPLSELEWHANSHFEEEDALAIARDMELAQAIALAPPSPVSQDAFVELSLVPEPTERWLPESYVSGSRLSGLSTNKTRLHADVQSRSGYHKVEGGVLNLLKDCIEKENKDLITVITGYVDHFQSTESEDSGWGCGWRNIQMLSSHLLMQSQDAREVIFGGCGFVPDILSLQRLLEAAWDSGFDVPGSEQLGKKVYGTEKWIGTTECAALLRSFGLRARVVDFDSKANDSRDRSKCDKSCEVATSKGKMKAKPNFGPMDKFLVRGSHPGSTSENGRGHEHCSSSAPSNGSCTWIDHDNRTPQKIDGHQVLATWVWNHFMDGVAGGSNKPNKILFTNKPPLYFQHDGHSRTIVGIQRQKRPQGEPNIYTLLILDPALRTTTLETCLRQNNGWQRLVKRGSHTLKKPQYQVCYVDPGVAEGEELEQLKTVHSILVKL